MINNIWILIGKKLNGEASAEELLELDELLQQLGPNNYSITLLEELWRTENQPPSKNDLLEKKWDAFEAKLDLAEKKQSEETARAIVPPKVNPRGKTIRLLKIFTGLAAACILVFFLWNRQNATPTKKISNVIVAPQGAITKIQLPDGTKVWLNSGSKLVYSSDFGQDCRKVSLMGEAFFDVVKDAKHPFILTTASIRIRVLGTAFNVRSYTSDKTSEAALIRGRIELTVLKNPEKKIILKASEKLTVINNEPYSGKIAATPELSPVETPLIALSRIHQAQQDSLPSEAQWMENKLAFDAESFEDLAKRMERRYNVTIVFNNERTKDLKFTGKFQNEPIDKALRALQTTTYFHFKTNNGQIVIY